MSNVVTNDIERPEHRDEAAAPLSLTCPPWCTMDADGHQWDVGRDQWPVRDHEAAFDAGEVGIYLTSEERLTPEGFTIGDPRVVITPPPGGDSFPVDQVRGVVKSLTAVLAAVAQRAPVPVPDWLGYEYSKGDAGRRYQAIVDRDKRVKLAAPATIPACPPWCKYASGHSYDGVTDDEVTFIRYHSAESASDGAGITQEERNLGGVVTLCPPVISLYAEDCQEISAGEARSRAGELLALADELDGLLRAV